jgi:hypothetical protein
VQVNGTVSGDIVREAHDGLNVLVNEKRRTGRNAIVALEGCGFLVWVDLLAQGEDVDLIVVNWLACDWIGHSPGSRRGQNLMVLYQLIGDLR